MSIQNHTYVCHDYIRQEKQGWGEGVFSLGKKGQGAGGTGKRKKWWVAWTGEGG